jgi:hypothetical protein
MLFEAARPILLNGIEEVISRPDLGDRAISLTLPPIGVAAPVRALSREERELMIAANNGYLLAFDNLSGLPNWLSDALCRLATGGSFAVRQLYTDEPIKDWSLTSLKDKLIKIGAKVVSDGRYVAFQMAEVAIHGKCSRRYCGSLRNCGHSHHQRQRKTFDGHAIKSNRRQECARMPGEIGQIRHSNAARPAWNARSHPHRASGLHPVQEMAIIPDCSGLIRGIPA